MADTVLERMVVLLDMKNEAYLARIKESQAESVDFSKSVTESTDRIAVSYSTAQAGVSASLKTMTADFYDFKDAGYKFIDTLEEATEARRKMTAAFADQVTPGYPVGPMQGPMPVGELAQMPTFVNDTREAKLALDQMLESLQDQDLAAKKLHGTYGKLNFSFRDSRHALHILASTTGLGGPAVHEAMMAMHAYHLMEKSIHQVGKALLTVKGAMVGVGIGAAVGGLVVLYKAWEKFKEEQKEIAELSKKAFEAMASGAESAGAAIRNIKVEGQTKAITEISEKIETLIQARDRPAVMGWHALFGGIKPMSEMISIEVGKATAKIREAQATAKMISDDPAMQGLIKEQAVDRGTQAVQKQMEELRKESILSKYSEEEKKAYAQAAELVAKGYMTMEEAIQKTGAAELLEDQRSASAREERKRIHEEIVKTNESITEHAAALEDEAATLGMGSIAATRYKEIHKLAREQSISLAEAEKRYGDELDRVAEAEARMARNELVNKTRDMTMELQKEIVKLTQGADAAERFAMAQEYSKKTGLSVAESQKVLAKELDNVRKVQNQSAALKLYEETQTPQEKYARRLKDLQRLHRESAIGMVLYRRGVMEAQDSILKLNEATEKLEGTDARSLEAQSKLQDYYDRNIARVPDNAYTTGGYSFTPSPPIEGASATGTEAASKVIDAINKNNPVPVLNQIRDTLRARPTMEVEVIDL